MFRRPGTGDGHQSVAAVFAVAAVAVLLAVPFMTAVGSDADFGHDSNGYLVSMDEPTDEEIEKYGVGYREESIAQADEIFSRFFNLIPYDIPSLKFGSYLVTTAYGSEIGTSSITEISVEDVHSERVSMQYVQLRSAPFIDLYYSMHYKELADAIENFFCSTVHQGDILSFSGDVQVCMATREVTHYVAVDSGHSVADKGTLAKCVTCRVNVRIGYLEAGSSVGSSIRFVSDCEYALYRDVDYDYGAVDYPDLTPLSPCSIIYSDARTECVSGSQYFEIQNEKYYVDPGPVKGYKLFGSANIMTDSEVNMNWLKEFVNDMPPSSGNVSVYRTYADAVSLFKDIELSVTGKDMLGTIKTVGGVVLVAAVAAIFAFVLMDVRRYRGSD